MDTKDTMSKMELRSKQLQNYLLEREDDDEEEEDSR
jgi:hypothetical protein